MICPRCQANQPEAAECMFCGVVIAKAKAPVEAKSVVEKTAPPQPVVPQPAPVAKQRPPLPSTKTATVWLSARDRQQMFVQLERMARSGVPLPEALEHAAAVIGGKGGAALMTLAQRLAAGGELLGEMQRLPGHFDAIDLAMIEAAQHTGKLPEVATRLAARHAHAADLRTQLLGSLSYPAFLVISSGLLSPVQLLFTQGIGAYLADVSVSVGIMLACGLGAYVGLQKLQRSPRLWDGLGRLEPAPGMGFLLRARRYSLVFDVLAMSLQAGLPLGRALELAGAAPGEAVTARAMQKTLQSLRTLSLSDSVPQWPAPPPKTKERVAAAERSGHLPEIFGELAGEARERLTVGLKRATQLLRGLITAVAIGVVVWSLISQVTKMVSDPFSAIPGEEGEQLRRELEQTLPSLLKKE